MCFCDGEVARGENEPLLARRAIVVNDQDLVIEARAETTVGAAIEPKIGADVVAALDALPPGPESRAIGSHPPADDGDEPATWLQAKKGLFDVPRPKCGPMTLDPPAGRREGRVHHDGIEALAFR